MRENAGYLVETKTGKRGRTWHKKGLINGKVPVYLEDENKENEWSETAILCDPTTLKIIGFID